MEPINISINETARILGVGRSTIYRMLAEKRLEAIKIGSRNLIRVRSIRNLGGDQV